jgi:hypothetical protein
MDEQYLRSRLEYFRYRLHQERSALRKLELSPSTAGRDREMDHQQRLVDTYEAMVADKEEQILLLPDQLGQRT